MIHAMHWHDYCFQVVQQVAVTDEWAQTLLKWYQASGVLSQIGAGCPRAGTDSLTPGTTRIRRRFCPSNSESARPSSSAPALPARPSAVTDQGIQVSDSIGPGLGPRPARNFKT